MARTPSKPEVEPAAEPAAGPTAETDNEVADKTAPGSQRTKRLVTGAAIGIGSAYGLTRLIESLLFGVKARDPMVFIAVPVALIMVALAAVWLPATRASRGRRVLRTVGAFRLLLADGGARRTESRRTRRPVSARTKAHRSDMRCASREL